MTVQCADQPDVAENHAAVCVIAGHATIDEIVFDHGDPTEVLGGAAVYATCGATQAGGQVSLITLTGPDYDFAPLLRSVADLTAGTVDVSRSRAGPAGTIRNQCRYRGPEDRQWTVLDWDAMVAMSPGWDAVATAIPPAASLLICPTPVRIAAELARNAARRVPTVIVDTEVHYLTNPESAGHIIERARCGAILMPSWVHLPALFGVRTDRQDGAILREVTRGCAETGVDLIVIKRGAAGSVVIDVPAQCWTAIPAARRRHVVDPTGAGDVFDGAFAVTFARTGDPVEAACWGSMAASFAVEHQGATIPPHFCRDEALARLRQIRSAISGPISATPKETVDPQLPGAGDSPAGRRHPAHSRGVQRPACYIRPGPLAACSAPRPERLR